MKAQAHQLQLPTYAVGDFVLVRTRWGGGPSKSGAKLVARIEHAAPLQTDDGDLWVVRCYYSPDRKMRSPVPGVPLRGWGKHIEHRHVDRALNPAEIVHLRNAGVIPSAGSELPR